MLNLQFDPKVEPFSRVKEILNYIAAACGGPLDMHDEPDFWSEREYEFRQKPFSFNNTNTVFFVKTESPFSQWHPSVFNLNGNKFVTAEQYMMYQKALLFEDEEAATGILNTDDPSKQKAFGRQVRNFDPNLWNSVCRTAVYEGNIAKFSQNESLRDALLKTEDYWLVEAAHYDPVWGIGLRETDPLANDIRTWKGTNWLGFTLMMVRAQL